MNGLRFHLFNIRRMRLSVSFFILLVFLTGCTENPASQEGQSTTGAPVATSEPAQPSVQRNPTATPLAHNLALPTGINPLTGLVVQPVESLSRRPVIVKIQNAPRQDRPPFGLSMADVVYEYSIEFGDTRFAAIFYSQLPEKVGPIRSARHIDIHIVRGYKSVFVFGGAYDELLSLLSDSDFGDRLVREGPNTAPALFRYDPEGRNYLLADLMKLDPILEMYDIDNQRQDLAGMSFAELAPAGGELGNQLFIRFSGATYARWDYDPESGRFLRFSEIENDLDDNNPQLAPLTDRNTQQQIGAENVVILQAVYFPIIKNASAEVYDIQLIGTGPAYLARDGMVYPLSWKRESEEDVVRLVDANGEPFPFKPGQTWFEVISSAGKIEHADGDWAFRNWLP